MLNEQRFAFLGKEFFTGIQQTVNPGQQFFGSMVGM
jgi:hypothetical protein